MSHASRPRESDNIDFRQLEIEIHNIIEATEKYKRENDAKLRAMNQKVSTYEEFREIVNAAHLKPISTADKQKPAQKVWNSTLTSKNNTEISYPLPSAKFIMSEYPIPSNGHEFEKYWRKLSTKTEFERFEFLKLIGGTTIAQIFKSEIIFSLHGEIISTLMAFDSLYVTDFVMVVEILQAMTQAKRFNLTLQFLSAEDKIMCHNLFEKLWKSMGDKLQDLADSGISEITINNLMSCYNVNIH
ncbi:Coiled-coil domain-containing protein 103 [Nymphon striatum]|nr:Coiled-coil domain-containing protein 103 [Nymphon striatum]